jgi:excisionase family DNA binding protein
MEMQKAMAKTNAVNGSAYPSVAALAQDIGMCERSTREALRRNEIPHIRIGKRYILPRAAIQDWLRNAGQQTTGARQ